jgi:hypothetical protein
MVKVRKERRIMLGIPRRHSHIVFGLIQSGLTSLIAAGIASWPEPGVLLFLRHWLVSWLVAWALMVPVVLLAAPAIRAVALWMTREERVGSPAGAAPDSPP